MFGSLGIDLKPSQNRVMKLTKNFDAYEFDCPCGQCDGGKIDMDFVERLQLLRDRLKQPVYISSGFRCDLHNSRISGSSADSLHIHGLAVDIHARDPEYKYRLLEIAFSLGFTGIGVYKSHIHLDMRENEYGVVWSR